MRLILDLQGFKDDRNKFIPKELAAFDGDKITHYIFKQPYPLSFLPPEVHKQAVWLMKNYHCIKWNDGYTPLHQFANIIQRITGDVDFVYVKGSEKADYIRKYCKKPIVELDEQPILYPSEPRCIYHSKTPSMCSLTNVFDMYNNFFMNQ